MGILMLVLASMVVSVCNQAQLAAFDKKAGEYQADCGVSPMSIYSLQIFASLMIALSTIIILVNGFYLYKQK